jgi:hypothetical protein
MAGVRGAVASAHIAPKSADEWIEIAEREASNLRKAFRGQMSNDVKVEHALRAVEAVLKAIVWKHLCLTSWPRRQKPFKFLYAHNFDALLENTGLKVKLHQNPELRASWSVIVNAVERQPRYSTTPPSDAEANAVAKSVRYPDTGVMPWLLKHYRTMK